MPSPFTASSSLRLAGLFLAAVLVGALVWLSLQSGGDAVNESVLSEEDEAFADAQHMGTVALPDGRPAASADGVRTYQWADLVPEDGAGALVELRADTTERDGMPTDAEFGGIAPEELLAFVQDIDAMRGLQPPGARIRTDLDGQTVRIPGYITPVGFDDTRVTEFLLVPFLGACIHVPPPPANQIVYVTGAEDVSMDGMWEPIWVTGVLRANPVATVLADVGYRIENPRVEPYS